jgi:hypothetical protein
MSEERRGEKLNWENRDANCPMIKIVPNGASQNNEPKLLNDCESELQE